MALKQITSTDLANKGVSGMPDVPGLSTSEMQAKLEEIVRDVVIPAFNDNALNTYDKIEVAAQISQKIIEIGAGDMTKSIYDPKGGARQVAFYDELLNLTHPIGSIYTSTVATEPSTLFGGTWQRIKDSFLLAAGDTYTAGQTGGEASHLLTMVEMPTHSHGINRAADGTATGFGNGYLALSNSYQNADTSTADAGSGRPHNNMPPYLTVYVWKRTA